MNDHARKCMPIITPCMTVNDYAPTMDDRCMSVSLREIQDTTAGASYFPQHYQRICPHQYGRTVKTMHRALHNMHAWMHETNANNYNRKKMN
jgi:hypothetical protein